jgi:hypothetical protein
MRASRAGDITVENSSAGPAKTRKLGQVHLPRGERGGLILLQFCPEPSHVAF